MRYLVEFAVRLLAAGSEAYARKWSFLAVFAFVSAAGISVLGAFDMLPGAPAAREASVVNTPAPRAPEAPVKVEIPAIGLAVAVSNPATTDIAALDAELLAGAVRYPTSARLGEDGNVVIFGHSSYLPVVRNQAYKAFNDIQKLSIGDSIVVYSADAAYEYAVTGVAKESADDAGIPLSVSGRVLTLSTCDSFGKKTDRFVVTAGFVGSHAISG